MNQGKKVEVQGVNFRVKPLLTGIREAADQKIQYNFEVGSEIPDYKFL